MVLCLLLLDFNSIKVQLKLFGLHCNRSTLSLFQFHKGTIKTIEAPAAFHF